MLPLSLQQEICRVGRVRTLSPCLWHSAETSKAGEIIAPVEVLDPKKRWGTKPVQRPVAARAEQRRCPLLCVTVTAQMIP
jgi:hypothetical protein